MGTQFITGDTHGEVDIHKLTTKHFEFSKDMSREDVMTILGDWGGIWYGNQKDNYMIKWWENKPWTTFSVLGNHENYNAIETLPIVEAFGGKCYQAAPHVFLAVSGEVYNICGNICLVINGANSTDKYCRKENISWWAQEEVTQEAVDNALENVKKYGGKVDYILSHTGGSQICHAIGFDTWTSDTMLDKVLDAVEYREHWCGHYHIDKSFYLPKKHRICYDDICILGGDFSLWGGI